MASCPSLSGLLLVCLQLYFILMNLTVERNYCHDPLSASDQVGACVEVCVCMVDCYVHISVVGQHTLRPT